MTSHMKTACGIGYHILHDKMTPEQRTRLLAHLITIQPAAVNVVGAERYPESLGYVEQILAGCPNTLVFERRIAKPNNQGGDEGIWQLDTDVWYDWRVLPYLWVLAHPRVVVMYDNESTTDDLTPYAQKMAAAMRRADRDGVAIAYGRFATGNPKEHQYAQLDPMWRQQSGSRHWWSPNEYAGPNAQASAGNLFRFPLGWQRCIEIGVHIPKTAIGETGVLVARSDGALDPYLGWRSLGWSERRLADVVIDNWREWYRLAGVPVSYFAAEAHWDDTWDDMTVGEQFFERIEEKMADLQIPFDAEAQGGKPYQEIVAEVVNAGAVTFRADKTTASARLGSIKSGDTIRVLPAVAGQDVPGIGNLWIPVYVEGVGEGYAHAHYLKVPGNTPPDVAAIRAQMKAQMLQMLDGWKVEIEAL